MSFGIRFKFAGYENKERLLRRKCYYVGRNTRICNNEFGSEPYMISIGNDVIIAAGVKFIEHDASYYNVYRYLKNKDYMRGEKIGPIILRDNCFIGGYSILLLGADVGYNSIIAAGSIVNKKIPNNEVWGGIPARFIMSLEDYACKVDKRIENLPWIDEKNRLSEAELIRRRQRYYFSDEVKKQAH